MPSLSLVIETEGRVVLNLPDWISLYCGLSIFASLPVSKQFMAQIRNQSLFEKIVWISYGSRTDRTKIEPVIVEPAIFRGTFNLLLLTLRTLGTIPKDKDKLFYVPSGFIKIAMKLSTTC